MESHRILPRTNSLAFAVRFTTIIITYRSSRDGSQQYGAHAAAPASRPSRRPPNQAENRSSRRHPRGRVAVASSSSSSSQGRGSAGGKRQRSAQKEDKPCRAPTTTKYHRCADLVRRPLECVQFVPAVQWSDSVSCRECADFSLPRRHPTHLVHSVGMSSFFEDLRFSRGGSLSCGVTG